MDIGLNGSIVKAIFFRSGTLVIREEELAETGKIIIYHFDGMSIIRI